METKQDYNNKAKQSILESAETGNLEAINLVLKYGLDINNYYKDELVKFLDKKESIIDLEPDNTNIARVAKVLYINTKKEKAPLQYDHIQLESIKNE